MSAPKTLLKNGRSWPEDITGYLSKKQHEKRVNRIGWVLIAFVALLIGGCVVGKYAHAQVVNFDGIKIERVNYSREDAIKAIIGEAENQGYKGMLAVACAIRNRGTLKGVYGLRAKRVRYSLFNEEAMIDAKLAWEESAKHDITNGATLWENINAFGCPSWVKSCVETFRYKNHVFYREVRA